MQNPLDLFVADVRAARIRRNLTQRQLADNLHMSVRSIDAEVRMFRRFSKHKKLYSKTGSGLHS